MQVAPSSLRRHPGPQAALEWLRAQGATRLVADSRRVQPGDAFVAWPGHAVDARQFVPAALAAGAQACLVEAQGAEAYAFADPRIAALAGLKAATGVLASAWLGEPSQALEVIAVTGTNGKTSTAWWTAQALGLLGRRCAVVGTLGVGEPPAAGADAAQAGSVQPTGLTTPDPVTLQAAFRRFVDQGIGACAIEASSIGLVEHRLAGTRIAVAQFTNLTQDHLDFHGSMQAYGDAKRQLFAWPGLRAAVLNVDDAYGAELAGTLAGTALDLWTVSAREGGARLRALEVAHGAAGLAFVLAEGGQAAAVSTRLVGDFNVSNLLVVAGGLRALGVPLADIASAFARLAAVPGRMQRVPSAEGAPAVVVDYAHTPDALEQALRALRPWATGRGGRLWCVFGCGGNRDAGKRPLMGAIAERLADAVVLTSDNPRHEPPAFILSQILAGVVGHDDVAVIEDRAEAIADTLARADAHDVVLIAGKGHEAEQEIAGVKRPFSDARQALDALQRRAAGGSRPS